ncbi:hypothetical protein [Ruminococcus sp.]|uniref:hypothetical protein n=1 Tax=Ruminococcus sp. TaxID=41978 RepID=UPI0025CD58E8|nr:hypothetical protein [Ruminococcus sp.]
MEYNTTKVRSLKSYPTYQFYAKADSKTVGTNDVFKICILETLRWIRIRLQNFPDMPNELNAPEPEQYCSFSEDELSSFSYNNGFQIDVIYIDAIGAWSFRITEPDMGANLGTPRERPAVNGRSFTTEIAFLKQSDCIEIGMRTICSEPSDTSADCEVFRPRVVKALAENEHLRLLHSGWIIDGKPLEIKSKAELERFLDVLEDQDRSLPVVLIADSKTEISQPKTVALPPVTPSLSADKFSFSGFTKPKQELSISGIADSLTKKNAFSIPSKKEKKAKESTPSSVIKKTYIQTKLPVFDYSKLARSLIGFAIVVFSYEKYFKSIENKAHLTINHGDILLITKQESVEKIVYKQYQNDMQGFFNTLKKDVISMQKRSAYSFGNVMFYSDAKLKEYKTKRHQTSSLEEKCSIYKLENTELKAKIKELSQQQTDMQQTAENLRVAQKKIDSLSAELDAERTAYDNLFKETAAKEDAYRKSTELVQFYQHMIDIAALFPIDKKDVFSWIEENYSELLFVAPRAQSELRKYNGFLDLACLCDGIVFLSAYAKYRRQELSEEALNLYSEHRKWEIQGCGKEALKVHRADYTVTIDGEQYILDQHIKRGVRTEELIRIYFCWDDKSRKIIIGSMPEHLATVRKST